MQHHPRLRQMHSSLIMAAVLMLAFIFRTWGFDSYPLAGETKDEFAWTWLGESLLSGDPPTSWSWFEAYSDAYVIELAGSQFRIVQPTFDNPPLFSLIPGMMVRIFGPDGIQLPSIRIIRLPMIFIGVVNVFLLFLVAKHFYSYEIAVVSTFLYAVIPSFVFGSRLVVAENLLITWMLLSVLTWMKYETNHNGRWLLVLGLLSGLSILTKVAGVAIPLTWVVMLWQKKQLRKLVWFFAIVMMISSLWLVYAFVFDWNTFWLIQMAQGTRAVGFASVVNLFIHQHIAESMLMDGWVILGFVLLFSSLTKITGKISLFHALFICWLLIFILTTAEQTWHGWYKFTMFPLMAMLIGSNLVSEKSLMVRLIPVYFLGIFPTLRLAALMNGDLITSTIFRLIVLITITTLVLLSTRKSGAKIHRGLIAFTLVFILISSGWVVTQIDEHALSKDIVTFYEK